MNIIFYIDESRDYSNSPIAFERALLSCKRTKFGKPYLEGEGSFSRSDAHSHCACLIGDKKYVALDIESTNRSGLLEISKRLFPRITRQDEIQTDFLTAWTVKESILKALGLGLKIRMPNVRIVDESVFYRQTKIITSIIGFRYFTTLSIERGEYVCAISFLRCHATHGLANITQVDRQMTTCERWSFSLLDGCKSASSYCPTDPVRATAI